MLWGDKRLLTTLSFIYLAEREDEPVVRALRDVLAPGLDAAAGASEAA